MLRTPRTTSSPNEGKASESPADATITGEISPASARILGRVVSESGEPVPGAKVKVMRFGDSSLSRETMADGNGVFSFDWDQLETVAVSSTAEGFATQSTIVDLVEQSTSLSLTLPAIHFVKDYEIKADTPELKIDLPDNSVSIEIPDPARALGTTGPIRVEVSSPSSGGADVPMPGGFMAILSRTPSPSPSTGEGQGGGENVRKQAVRRSGPGPEEIVQLASVAYADITLRDSAGNEIHELNSPAKVRMKITPGTLNPATNAPFKIGDTVPMWYIDPDAGTWVPEIDEKGEQTVGTVLGADTGLQAEFMAKHFTWWNLDQPISTRHCLRGRVIDPCNLPVTNVSVCANGVSFQGASCRGATKFVYKREDGLGQEGLFCLDILKGSTVDLQVGRGGIYKGRFDLDEVLWQKQLSVSGTEATCGQSPLACTDLGDVVVLRSLRRVVGRIVNKGGEMVGHALVSVNGRVFEAAGDGHFELRSEPTENLTISFTHPKGAKFGQTTRGANIPGVTPEPGKCEQLPPIDLGDIPMNTETGCLRGKVVDETGNVVQNANLALGGSFVQSDRGGNYCLESLTGAQELNLRLYDRGRGRLHTKKAPYQIVGGGYCGGGDERCVHADIVVELGDACISGTVKDQAGKPLDSAVVQIGNQMVTTDKTGHYCIQAQARAKQSIRFRAFSGIGGAASESEETVEVETSGPGLCSANAKKNCTSHDATIRINQPPAIDSIKARDKRVDPSEETEITLRATDPEDAEMGFVWSSTGGEVQAPNSKISGQHPPSPPSPSRGEGTIGNPLHTASPSPSTGEGQGGSERPPQAGPTRQITWKAPAEPGVYTVSVIAKDDRGATAIASVEIPVGQDQDGDGFIEKIDCDDRNSSVHPGAPEICDQTDNDCNGKVDDVPATMVFWKDQDGDGYTDGTFLKGCPVGPGWTQTAKRGDCRDDLSVVTPGAVEICDGLDNNCDGQIDENTGGGSCNTTMAGTCSSGSLVCAKGTLACAQRLSPTAESCDGLDNDCDGLIDENLGGQACNANKPGLCSTGDMACKNGVMACIPRLAPTAESCDGLDNDCDGTVDENCECIDGKSQPCYTGPAGSNSVGVCRAGTQTCASGIWGVCAGQKLPAPEICDGVDNDCNGQADEQTGGGSCSTGQPGVCAQGAMKCASGSLVCAPLALPSAERCDGLDNDCDGLADENFPTKGESCSTGTGACEVEGVVGCSTDGTSVTCLADPRSPTPELCDGFDNDCDGLADEDFLNRGQNCLAGTGACQAAGVISCSADGTGTLCSAVPLSPSPELCDTVDNDCDGVIDNGCSCVDGTSRPCYSGLAGTAGTGLCSMGSQSCPGGQWGICAGETTPAMEVCDGLDNNCNGQVDENTGGAACSTGKPGLCAEGTLNCVNGALICAQRLSPSAEICEGLDNDCDGSVDETFSTKGQICMVGIGQCQASGSVVCTIDGSGTVCSAAPRPPAPELCDSLDNDCDGSTDEDFFSKGHACSEGVGMCQATGTFQCSSDGSVLICSADPWPPTPESCDAFDNDCDGLTDEGCNCLDGATQPCYMGPANTEGVGLCTSGTQTCSSGNWGMCSGQKTPGAELCDGQDNDCDTAIDEETGGGSCSTGQSGVCSAGTFACSNGALTCAQRLSPSAESCDGLDNDCDASTDETFTNLGQSCSAGAGECKTTGAFICLADGSGSTCSVFAGAPLPELCDGLDNDCDGQTDEDNVCIPAAPSNLTATAISSSSIRLNWTDNSTNETGFIIERKIGSTDSYTQLASTAANTTPYTDSGLTEGTDYWYRVAAYSAKGISPYSAEASALRSQPKITAIAAGGAHTCGLAVNGEIKCWGSNGYGALGDGTTTSRPIPITVPFSLGAAAISTGLNHTCEASWDGSVRCWGDNFFGQLGDGTTKNRLTPQVVSSITDAVAISSGPSHTCALAADGTASCWGATGSGEKNLVPIKVSGLHGVVALSAGNSHTCALLLEGTVWCWGANWYGQLGDGTTTGSKTPVHVSSLTNVVAIATGFYHTCALEAEGAMKCWGLNWEGQLGNGSFINLSTPLQVFQGAEVKGISCGSYHTCALVSDGTVNCWGDNFYGQVGDGSTSNRGVPVPVLGLTGATSVTAGYSHACGLVAEGVARCWGNNGSGQLGDGTTTNRLTPVQVLNLP
ncbi:MAG: carboxypeptidase regulatory-like domain-containing protein [Nitrospirae bacterium]|nr:carboxypeptidase regulatory-like domain-containing protein [Nitrospirota bacterium]